MTPQQIRRLYPEVDDLPYDLGILQRRTSGGQMGSSGLPPKVGPILKGDSSDVGRLALTADSGLDSFKKNVPDLPALTRPLETTQNDSSHSTNADIVNTAYVDSIGRVNNQHHSQPAREFSSINFLNSLTVSSAVKVAAFAAVGFYIYKSVKDGGVQTVEGGPKRNIFKWVDAAGGLIIAIYLFNMAKSTLMF